MSPRNFSSLRSADSLSLALALVALLTCPPTPSHAQHRLAVQGNGVLAVVDRDQRVEWQMPWGAIHDIHRLENGHLLVQQGPAAIAEIDPETKTTLEVLPNGNYVIGNCHAGPGNPLLIEVEPKSKRVMWTFDQHAVFGNNVSNSLILDVPGSVR
ncbi:MAG: hypothetical protein HY000_06295 [Planctomycetes bacterium]|nr:hypothetical protein [Planctomycetota bacterium]